MNTRELKRQLKKFFPYFLAFAVVWGAYTAGRTGAFRRGIVPGITIVASNVPVVGSFFKKSARKYYSKGRKSYTRKARKRRSRRRRR